MLLIISAIATLIITAIAGYLGKIKVKNSMELVK